jgi:hypothetical protein
MLNGRCAWRNNEMRIKEIRHKDADSVELVRGPERELCHAMQSNLMRPVCNFLYTFHEFNSFLVCYWPWKWKYRPGNKSVAGIVLLLKSPILTRESPKQASVKVMLTCLLNTCLAVQVNSATPAFRAFDTLQNNASSDSRCLTMAVIIYVTHFYPYSANSVKWTYNGEGSPLLQHTYLSSTIFDLFKQNSRLRLWAKFEAVPQLRRLVASFPSRRPGFDPRSSLVRFVKDKVALANSHSTKCYISGAGTIGQLLADVPSRLSLTQPHET